MRKLIATLFLTVCAMMLGGCASVPTVTDQAVVNEAKSFATPAEGQAHVYVYRDNWLGRKINIQLYLDGKPFGESENKHFYLIKTEAGKTLHLETNSEFGNNKIDVKTESGKIYYVRHYTRFGLIWGQADFEMITDPSGIKDAQESILDSEMATPTYK